jgi:dipeptidyl aminopeptidase/acylaminoacyl peptidase
MTQAPAAAAGVAPRYDVARYMNVRAAYAPEFLANGDLLFLSNITGVPQAWAQPATGGWPRQLTFEQERVGTAQASVTGDVLLAIDQGGDEHDQLYRLTPDGVLRPLTDDRGSIHRPGPWSPDGRRVVYAVNSRDRRYFDLWLLDLSGPEPVHRLLFQSDHTNHPGAWSPDGRRIIVVRNHKPSSQELLLLDLETGEATPLTWDREDVRYHHPDFSAGGDALYLLTDRDRDFLAPARMALGSAAIEVLDDTPWDAGCPTLSPDRGRLAYTHNVDGYSTLRVLDLATGRQMPLPDLPAGVIQAGLVNGQLAWSPDGRRLAYTFHGPATPMNVWVLDLDRAAAHQVTFAPDGNIPRSRYVLPETVRYTTFDDRQIPALYYRPAGRSGPLPVIVLVHGGPEGQSRPIYNPVAQYFVNRGYAVFLPNVRGSTGYGKAYSHLDDRRARMDSVRDLAACVEWLVERGGADKGRIAVMGASYGGFMTLAAVTNYPDLWAAGVDIVGIANFRTFLEHTGLFRRRLREAEYGSLEEDGDFLDAISPIHKAGEIRAPMIILHGENDPRVPVGESRQIERALREHEVPVVAHYYPDEGHGLVKLPNKVHGYTAIGDFLDRHLTGPSSLVPRPS